MGSGLNFLQRSFVSALRMLTKVSAGGGLPACASG